MVVTSVFFFRRLTKVYEAYQEQEAILSTTLQENLTGVRVVKAFARQAYEREKFEGDNWEKFRRGRRLATHALLLLADLGHHVRRSDAGGLHRRRADGHQRHDHRRHLPGLRRPGRSGSSGPCATWAA